MTTILAVESSITRQRFFRGFAGGATVGPHQGKTRAFNDYYEKPPRRKSIITCPAKDFVKAELRSPRSGCGLDKIRRTGT